MRTCDRTNFCSMSAWLSSSSSESHLYSFFSLLSSHPVRCNELERCESQRTVPIKWLTPEKLLLDRRHFGKERFRTWWECLSAFTRIITAGQLSPVTVVTESSRKLRSPYRVCHFLVGISFLKLRITYGFVTVYFF